MVKKTSSYLAEDRFSVVGIKVCKKSRFQLIEKIVICEKNFEVVLLHDFRHLHILIRPHILSTCDDTRFIVERSKHSHIQRYFCYKDNARKRI